MKLDEADAARRNVARRFQMSGQAGYFLLIVLVLAGAAAGVVIWNGPGMAIGVACAFLGYWTLANRFALKGWRSQLAERGLPPEVPVSMIVATDALTYEVADVRHIAKWNAVTEIFPSQSCWLFMVDSQIWALPRRLFSDKATERAFVAAALECMSTAARDRSGTARAFAAAA